MERMIESKTNESMLWKLLEKEGLADLSQFHQRRYFDEVPLCSRKSDIAFLTEDSSVDVSDTLVRFALKLLKAIISYESHRTPYLAAVTIWDFAGVDPVVPNLFVWSGPVNRLQKELILHVPKTLFGKKISRLVSKLRLPDKFEVLEDTSTDQAMSRVFIGLAQPSYPRFVTLDQFRKQRTSPAR
jgi:hypothetical protein